MTDTLPDTPLPPSGDLRAEGVLEPIAPWMHTLAVVALLAGFSVVAHFGHQETIALDRPIRYGSQILMVWMLLGCVVAGVYHRHLFFWNTLLHNRRPWFLEVVRGMTIYAACLVTLSFVVMAAMSILVLRHPDPSHVANLHEQVVSRLHLKNKTVESVAPTTGFELLLWTGVSLTAGFCEEHIFRGYLLRQALSFFSIAGASQRFATILSITVTSLLFGGLHLYEGVGGAIFVGILGLMYAILALRFGNLRAVIVAHSAQDFLVGLFLFLRHANLAR
jgi:uncharacterized protein